MLQHQFSIYYVFMAIQITQKIHPCNYFHKFTISVTANPQFVNDISVWKNTVIELVTTMKTRLQQSTVTIEFCETDVIYLA